MPRNPFDFRVITPEGLAFSARAEIAVLPGSEGDFAVLHGHAPMVAALGK
ncbi:MAG TPA: hypothetical protein GX506_08050, partial [Firmicutes bacterium]|nr:hypothetical protein [Bacillota bacterium]